MSLLLKPNIIRGNRSKKNASIFHVSIKIWDYCKLCFGIFLRQSSVTSFKQRQHVFSFEPSLQKTCISLRSVPVIWLDCLTNVRFSKQTNFQDSAAVCEPVCCGWLSNAWQKASEQALSGPCAEVFWWFLLNPCVYYPLNPLYFLTPSPLQSAHRWDWKKHPENARRCRLWYGVPIFWGIIKLGSVATLVSGGGE